MNAGKSDVCMEYRVIDRDGCLLWSGHVRVEEEGMKSCDVGQDSICRETDCAVRSD